MCVVCVCVRESEGVFVCVSVCKCMFPNVLMSVCKCVCCLCTFVCQCV